MSKVMYCNKAGAVSFDCGICAELSSCTVFLIVFKIAEKKPQTETQKAVMKLFIKLHSMKQTSKHNRLQLSFALRAAYDLS